MENRSHQRHHERQNPSPSSLTQSTRSRNTNFPTHISNAHQVPEWRTRRRRASSSGISNTQKAKEDRDEDLSNFPTLIGTCPSMCPDNERDQRERLQDLAVFERLHGNPRKTSPSLAVKKFCRTISVKDARASDVRPLPVLEDTLTYLLNLLDSTDHPFEVVHDFIFDRTRSIRQDLSMQNIANIKAVHMYEKMVKFHVISHFKLRRCGGNPDVSSVLYLNMEQLMKALTSLYNLYDTNRCSNSIHGNESEFHSLYVLLHLDSRSQPMGESLSLWLRHVPLAIIHSKEMCFARSILRYFRVGNYKQFFCTIAAGASYLQYCIIEPYIDEVRALSLSCINSAVYKLHPYPLVHLSKLLKMKESDVELFCNACGLETRTDEAGNKLLPTKQTTFSCPKRGIQGYSFLGLEHFER